jgi:hypothetical protein
VPGRATWPGTSVCARKCACVGPRRGAGKAELTGRSHCAARGRGCTEGMARCADKAGPRGRDRKGRASEGNRCRQPGPTGQREGERARGRKPPLTGATHLLGGAGVRARVLAGPIGLLWPFLFP